MPASPELIRQYESLLTRCKAGRATPAACALLVKMEADIEAAGGPPPGMTITKAAAPMGGFLLYALAAYLAFVIFRNWKR